MPSPGIPKIVSTPQSISVSTSTSPPVMAISILHLVLLFENAPRALRSPRLLPPERNFIRRGREDNAPRYLRRVGNSGQRHRDVEFFAEDLERLGDARLAISAEAVEVGAADEAGARSEAEEFENVETRADATVDIDFGPIADLFHNSRQSRCGGWRAVELPAAMIRNEDRVGACVDRHLCVLDVEDAFDDQLARPERAHPFESLHVEGGIEL